jgi:circadian clock protein KaiB
MKTSQRSGSEADKTYILKLFIIGTRPNSSRAVTNVRKLCDEYLAGKYELEVVDISKHPERVKEEQIIAAPTLIKELPVPLRRFIGNMSDTEKLLVGLEVRRR